MSANNNTTQWRCFWSYGKKFRYVQADDHEKAGRIAEELYGSQPDFVIDTTDTICSVIAPLNKAVIRAVVFNLANVSNGWVRPLSTEPLDDTAQLIDEEWI